MRAKFYEFWVWTDKTSKLWFLFFDFLPFFLLSNTFILNCDFQNFKRVKTLFTPFAVTFMIYLTIRVFTHFFYVWNWLFRILFHLSMIFTRNWLFIWFFWNRAKWSLVVESFWPMLLRTIALIFFTTSFLNYSHNFLFSNLFLLLLSYKRISSSKNYFSSLLLRFLQIFPQL